MINQRYLLLGLLICYMLFIIACGKSPLKNIEYNINGEWLRCSQVSNAECGITLTCGDQLYQCMNNLETRFVD